MEYMADQHDADKKADRLYAAERRVLDAVEEFMRAEPGKHEFAAEHEMRCAFAAYVAERDGKEPA